MPFDGLAKTYTADLNHCSIDTLLASLGIEPVSKDILEQHKVDQVNKHPASFFFRHPALHRVLTLASSVGAVASTFLFMSYNFVPSAASITVLAVLLACLMATTELVLFTRVKRPSAWRESQFSVRKDQAREPLPPPILNLVRQIDDASDGVRFTVGTLYQEQVVLDPYIVVEKYDHETMTTTAACLGIWDGDRILHIASQS